MHLNRVHQKLLGREQNQWLWRGGGAGRLRLRLSAAWHSPSIHSCVTQDYPASWLAPLRGPYGELGNHPEQLFYWFHVHHPSNPTADCGSDCR